jgi:segregation and condensation protein A
MCNKPVAYEVTLDKFSGPLDLLLHLIRKQEVNIHDIAISKITEQYLAYLRAMEELSLDIASEFLVMAATLLAIKSRMLLPKPKNREDVEEDDVDPREELIQQLIEYQRCKAVAEELRNRELLQSQVFSRTPMDLRPFEPESPPQVEGVSMWDIVDAYRKMLIRVPKEERIAEIKGQVISVEDTMKTLTEKLRRWQQTTFFELIEWARSRPEIVSSFLALLELIKLGRIQCTQVLAYGDIEIRLVEERVS